MNDGKDAPVETRTPQPFWDIACFVEDRPDRRFVWAGIIISLALHFGYVGRTTYDAYQRAKDWRSLLTLRVIDQPAGAGSKTRIEMIDLRNPLYYPPSLVRSPNPAPAAKGRLGRTKREQPVTDQGKETGAAATEVSGVTGDSSTQQVQDDVQLLQKGIEQARTINIAPIKEQIIRIYTAQQAGEISLKQVTVAVNFKIRSDGAFTNVHLVQSSGIPEVDNAALFIADELNKLRALVPLRETESATIRLTIGESVEFSVAAASATIAEAEQNVRELNGLLLAARLLGASRDARLAAVLARTRIAQEGVNVVASISIPRAEATEMFKSAIKLRS